MVQPVIHRETVKTEIRHIIQPIYEEVTLPPQIHESKLVSADTLESQFERQARFEELRVEDCYIRLLSLPYLLG